MVKDLLYTIFIVGSFAWIVDLIMWNRQKRIDEENRWRECRTERFLMDIFYIENFKVPDRLEVREQHISGEYDGDPDKLNGC